MHFLSIVGVDDALVEELWQKVEGTGGFYSIGDGVTKATFRRMLYESNAVLRGEGIAIRLSIFNGCLEVHPIVFGPSVFTHAQEALGDIKEIRDKLFDDEPICCIIPSRMRGAKRLALRAGLSREGECIRWLSGVEVPCTVFAWR